jgi:thymidine kinase
MAKLHFYYSAMNAGKTTTLLQSSYNYQERGMKTLLFTPLIDDRFKVGEITSRIGLSSVAISFDVHTNFFEYVAAEQNKEKINCVLVDEAQFLSKNQVRQLADVAAQLNIPVLAYGLRSDFLGEPFEGSKYLLTWAQELNEIKTICHCGRKATMNARIDAGGEMVTKGNQIEIGGNDRYIALCYKHYRLGQVKA